MKQLLVIGAFYLQTTPNQYAVILGNMNVMFFNSAPVRQIRMEDLFAPTVPNPLDKTIRGREIPDETLAKYGIKRSDELINDNSDESSRIERKANRIHEKVKFLKRAGLFNTLPDDADTPRGRAVFEVKQNGNLASISLNVYFSDNELQKEFKSFLIDSNKIEKLKEDIKILDRGDGMTDDLVQELGVFIASRAGFGLAAVKTQDDGSSSVYCGSFGCKNDPFMNQQEPDSTEDDDGDAVV